ncbi:hypothetical protein DINM_002383 [Dirofilaria immitis]|nr:hypothetical protein [Dirofilaria immitis]
MKLSTSRSTDKLASNKTDITSLAIELLEFIPSSLLIFFGDLNDTDRSALLELTRNISRSRLTADTEKEFLEGLKKKSENAYQKVMGVQNYLSHKIERLKPESKDFTKKLAFCAKSVHDVRDMQDVQAVIFQNNNTLISDPRFRDYVKRVFDNTDVKRAFNRADRMINPKQ